MLKLISISDFLKLAEPTLLLDARSEGEFEQGHIPGAISFPILNNDERKLVGTCYKQKGHQAAVILGYELVGPKFKQFVAHAYKEFSGQEIYIHCWRGGLRSQIMSNLLSSAGFKVNLIKGGYKTYRHKVLDFLNNDFEFEILGGFTGAGKSDILEEMETQGIQVLDIEKLANHKGSAFGAIGLPPQPMQEQFENNIFYKLSHFNKEKVIWVEDESRLIGRLQIPTNVYLGIRNGFVHFLNYSFDDRLVHIMNEYGRFEPNLLAEITAKLKKRMGDLTNRLAIESIKAGEVKAWAEEVLRYYDKQYLYGFEQRLPGKSRMVELKEVELITQLKSIKKAQLVG